MALTEPLAPPFDVRLMNMLATLLFALCALGVLIAFAGWVLRQPIFSIAALRVMGDVTHNNAVTLRAHVAPHLAGNFFTVDLARTRQAFESVPWVRKAVVQREFPNKLRATLIEHVPAAFWGDHASSRLVNGYGEVFEANVAEVDADLPRLSGPDGEASQVLGMLRELTPVLKAHDLIIHELALSSRGSWQATLHTGAVIELGRGDGEQIKAHVERFLRSVGRVAAQYGRRIDAVESADLRHADAYALRLRGVSVAVEVMPEDKPRPGRATQR